MMKSVRLWDWDIAGDPFKRLPPTVFPSSTLPEVMAGECVGVVVLSEWQFFTFDMISRLVITGWARMLKKDFGSTK